jgi:SAM-dependent methyltransferase
MEKELYDNIQQVEATHWWYRARREIIFAWVKPLLKTMNNPRALDLGCGTGYNLVFLQKAGCENAAGMDFSPDALAYCRSKGLTRLLCGDAQSLPLRAETYNLILTLDILEHLPNDELTLEEIQRALKPGGALVIFVPAYQFLWSFQDEISHHIRRYTARELKEKVLNAGFEIQKITYTNTFLFPLIWGGRLVLKLFRSSFKIASENDLNPSWTNEILYKLFKAELPWLKRLNFPFGVSILCVCRKPRDKK